MTSPVRNGNRAGSGSGCKPSAPGRASSWQPLSRESRPPASRTPSICSSRWTSTKSYAARTAMSGWGSIIWVNAAEYRTTSNPMSIWPGLGNIMRPRTPASFQAAVMWPTRTPRSPPLTRGEARPCRTTGTGLSN